MLLIDATLIKNIKKGSNLAEQYAARYETVSTSKGTERRPVFAYTYITGGNFVGHATVSAPVDLLAGDAIQVDQSSGQVVYVTRAEKRVFENEALLAEDDARMEMKRGARHG